MVDLSDLGWISADSGFGRILADFDGFMWIWVNLGGFGWIYYIFPIYRPISLPSPPILLSMYRERLAWHHWRAASVDTRRLES